MTKITLLNKAKYWILKIIQLQLLLSIISLPILISWGLPISILSPIGNIIFGPILVMFLFLSSLIFFFEIVSIPNQLLINSLEVLTNYWLKLLSFGSEKFLIAFACPNYLILLLIPLFAFAILHLKKTNNLLISTVILLTTLLVSGFLLKVRVNKNSNKYVFIDNKKFQIIAKDSKLTIVDKYENLSKSIISNNFIEYKFLTEMIKQYGHCKIENIIIKFNNQSIESLKLLLKKTEIKNIFFIKNIEKPFPDKFSEFNTIIKNKKTTINFVNNFDIKNI